MCFKTNVFVVRLYFGGKLQFVVCYMRVHITVSSGDRYGSSTKHARRTVAERVCRPITDCVSGRFDAVSIRSERFVPESSPLSRHGRSEKYVSIEPETLLGGQLMTDDRPSVISLEVVFINVFTVMLSVGIALFRPARVSDVNVTKKYL